MLTFEKAIIELEKLIADASGDSARRKLRLITNRKVPRQYRLPLARIGRRLGMTQLSLRLLGPLIRTPTLERIATDSETVEYAINLMRLGDRRGAKRLLESIDSTKIPEKRLGLGFLDILEWNYENALIHFEGALKQLPLSGYEQMVARINLSACYVVVGQHEEARDLLAELLTETKDKGWKQFHVTLLEYEAQNRYLQEDFEGAESVLMKASHLLAERGEWERLFIQKWLAIISGQKSNGSRNSLRALQEVRLSAIKFRHWETVRDCDRYFAIFTKSERLATHVYYGTPYESYRRQLRSKIPGLTIPVEYIWQVESQFKKQESKVPFDLRHSHLDSRFGISEGKALDRLLRILISDFYRPQPMGALFSAVYPDSFFHTSYSPSVMHRLIFRLRESFGCNKIPFRIDAKKGAFKLQATGSVSLRLDLASQQIMNGKDALLERLRNSFQGRWFTRREAERCLRTSASSLHRLFHSAIIDRVIEKRQDSVTVRYRFLDFRHR